MKRCEPVSFGVWLLLALAAWGGAYPRMSCSGSGGHIALESALSPSCWSADSFCTPLETPPRVTSSAEGTNVDRGAVSLAPRVKDLCSDSMIQYRQTTADPLRQLTSPPAVLANICLDTDPALLLVVPTRYGIGRSGCLRTPLDLRTTLLI